MEFEPLKLLETITTEVGSPRHDGTRGSALYEVPIRLSRRVTPEEAELLVHLWDHPPQFTSMHRTGIAHVAGDRFVLTKTTVEEVAQYHAETLRLIVSHFNTMVPAVLKQREEAAAAEAAREEQHRQHIEDVARNIRFD